MGIEIVGAEGFIAMQVPIFNKNQPKRRTPTVNLEDLPIVTAAYRTMLEKIAANSGIFLYNSDETNWMPASIEIQICDEHIAMVCATALRVTRKEAATRDVSQETFLELV